MPPPLRFRQLAARRSSRLRISAGRTARRAFGGLQRNTGMGVDSSGNLWLTNNWKNKPVQINPGGNGLVVFIGLAGPVRTPSIGVPVKR